ncbi:hypothetical protein MJG53_006576 [Ovis ammon polii x Ovis aries]|uniref:Uncharacterized protein n=1 Tax=Ovis ammon polii x Ovis aries TaxID=2918886 RepID=A0ACB9V5K4_9CETA|nr:hypothetical protein MJG53_006576 [Ovis ammon polii x Ovis aries]
MSETSQTGPRARLREERVTSKTFKLDALNGPPTETTETLDITAKKSFKMPSRYGTNGAIESPNLKKSKNSERYHIGDSEQ